MTTKASATSKNGKATTTVKNEVKKKLTQEVTGLQVQELSIGRIIPDPRQPRKSFNEEALKQLSESIKEHGVLQPITVRKSGKSYIIVMGLKMDYIFFASSSGGTQAGLKLGIDLFGLDIKLMPISIDKLGYGNATLDEAVLELLFEGKKALGIKKDYLINDATLIRGYDSQGYGVVTSNERKAINELAQSEGILLDPVYSARAFYGMLDHLENKKLRNNSNVLFWHTGGLPANFYYSDELI